MKKEKPAIVLTGENSPRLRAAMLALTQEKGEKYARVVTLMMSGAHLIHAYTSMKLDPTALEQLHRFYLAAVTELHTAYFGPEPGNLAEMEADALKIAELVQQDLADVIAAIEGGKKGGKKGGKPA